MGEKQKMKNEQSRKPSRHRMIAQILNAHSYDCGSVNAICCHKRSG